MPIWKHSRAVPEPLGWRKCPWPFLPLGYSREESAMMVMFSCKPAGSLLGRAQAGAYVNIFPFQTCKLCFSVVEGQPLQAGPPGVFSRVFLPFSFSVQFIIAHKPTSRPHSQATLLRFDPSPPFLSVLQPPAGVEVTISLLHSLPGPALCIELKATHEAWLQGCPNVCKNLVYYHSHSIIPGIFTTTTPTINNNNDLHKHLLCTWCYSRSSSIYPLIESFHCKSRNET